MQVELREQPHDKLVDEPPQDLLMGCQSDPDQLRNLGSLRNLLQFRVLAARELAS